MNASTRTWITAALLAGALCASAATQPRDHAARVAPYIDPQTMVIVYFDLAAFDFDAVATFGSAITAIPKEGILGFLSGPREWAASMTQAGGKELYWILSLDDIGLRQGLGAFVIAVVDPDGDADLVGRLLSYGASEAPEQPAAGPWQEFFGTGEVRLLRPGLLFCGHLPSYERITVGPPSPRNDLEAAFAAGGTAPVQVLVLPTDTHRRVIEEMLPRLPDAVGGGPSTALSRGFLHGNLSIGLPPDVFARTIVQSKDAQAAGAFRDMVAAGIESLVRSRDVIEEMPEILSLRDSLVPVVDGSRVVVALDRETIGDTLGKTAARTAARADDDSAVAVCRDRLRQIGIALAMYALDHKTLPANLLPLVPYGVDEEVATCPAGGPYEYFGAGVDLDALLKDRPRTVLARDAKPHAAGGYNVLFADGHVEFIETARLGAHTTAADAATAE